MEDVEFIKREELLKSNGLISNDELTIICRAQIYKHFEYENYGFKERSIDDQLSQLKLDNGETLDSANLPDFTIKVGGTILKANKKILASKSNVFYDLFNCKPKSLQIPIVEINKYSVEAVKLMINYINGDDISGIENMASEIIAIADEYQLDILKYKASLYLSLNLTIKNVCERFMLGSKFSSKQLCASCRTFITNNYEALIQNKNWKNFVINNLQLVEKLSLKSI
uniref:BTB domain-containing protein n=1 Tax=Strongyloides papillosus TaxID=174720 RepID=A0A0N5C6S6_STREA